MHMQVMTGIRWNGQERVLEEITELCGPDYQVASNLGGRLEIGYPDGHLKFLEPGNYVCLNEHGTVVLLTAERAARECAVIDEL